MSRIFYVSPEIRPMTWQTTLRELELKYNDWGNKMGMEDINLLMQVLYPGPYRVVEKYLPDRQVFGFVLKFTHPKEKTFWLLKNS